MNKFQEMDKFPWKEGSFLLGIEEVEARMKEIRRSRNYSMAEYGLIKTAISKSLSASNEIIKRMMKS